MVATGSSAAPTRRFNLELMNNPAPLQPTGKVPTLARALGWTAACFIALVAGSIVACSEIGHASVAPTAQAAGSSAAKATVLGAALASP
jgi:hypothetical protein